MWLHRLQLANFAKRTSPSWELSQFCVRTAQFFIFATIISASLRLSLIFACTTGEFLISSRFNRIAAMTAAAISFAFSVLAD
jgi:hypothetical protein